MLENSSPEFEHRIHKLHNPRFRGDGLHGRHVVGEGPMRISQRGLPAPHAIGRSPVMTEASPSSPLWPFTFFLQGSFLQGLTLYGAMPYPVGLLCFDDGQVNEEVSRSAESCQNRRCEGSRSPLFEVTGPDPEAGLVRKLPRAAPVAVSLVGPERSTAVASSPPDPRRRILSLAAAARWIWARWRREREIRRAVDALAKLDDRTLRDIGITDRSQIDRVVRFCRDC
jgi:uncharacterized protein YjiS (DUF1127 family)